MIDILTLALSKYGLTEIPGEDNNPEIVQMFKDIGHGWVQSDETAWCSAFINWCALKKGYEFSGKLNARSWLDVGEVVLEPNVGDVAVLWRVKPDSWKGHVGLFINKTDTHIYLLGGNQGNQVNISAYPVGRVLGYRKLRK